MGSAATDLRQPGTYVLLMRIEGACTVSVGGLGPLRFEAGYYAYVGSALHGLQARLSRHRRHTKRLRWHIDYLRQVAPIIEMWVHTGPERIECAWARTLATRTGLAPYNAPFGASDCACPTHLFYSRSHPSFQALRTALEAHGAVARMVSTAHRRSQRAISEDSQEAMASSTGGATGSEASPPKSCSRPSKV